MASITSQNGMVPRPPTSFEYWSMHNSLQGQICHLQKQLSMEYNWRVQVSQELEDTKQQLSNQKRLKELFINKEKEAKKELARLQNYSDAETLNASNIASQVRSNIKRRKKRDLQQDYEELKVAHIINEEKFNAELQAHKDKIKALEDELKLYQEKCNTSLHTEENNKVQDELKLSQEKVSAELKTEKENHEVLHNQLKLSLEKLTAELKTEKENHEVVQNQLKLSLEKLTAELKTEKENHEVLQNQLKLSLEKLAAELKTEKENNEDTQKLGQDKLMLELHLEKQKNLALNYELRISQTRFTAELQQKQQTVMGLKEDLKTLVQKMKDEQDTLYTEIENLRAHITIQFSTELQVEEGQEQPEEHENDLPQAEETETTPRKSTFKRFRHFLGLRKPQRWKRPAVPASTSSE